MPASEDLLAAFKTFYAQTIRPDVQGIVRSSERRVRKQLRREMRATDGHFDAVHTRLGHLETEYRMLVVGLRRLENARSSDAGE